MTQLMQALYGLAFLAIGGVKTWLHMGSVPVLSLPMCSGKSVIVSTSSASWFEQAHCWGCYVFAAGLIMVLFVAAKAVWQRRSVTHSPSVAHGMD